MAMPYALLRAGFPYVKTLGMRRVTDAPVDVAVGADDNVYVLCRLPGSSPIRKLTWDDDYLGPVGASEASFQWPVAIAMDAGDNIYVSDEAAHRITAVTTGGDFVGSWGEHGEGQGQLNGPSGIAFDLDGNLYVADTLNHRVQRFTGDGAFLSTWGSFGDGEGQFNMPWGVAVDPVGDVYVVDWRNDRVQKFDSRGPLHPPVRQLRRWQRPVQPPRRHCGGRRRRRICGRPGQSQGPDVRPRRPFPPDLHR